MAPNFQTLPDKVVELCTSNESVSSLLAQDPTLAPGDAWKKLYGHHVSKPSSKAVNPAGKGEVSPEELEKAARCGKWGPTKPSELFLRIYHDALCAIEDNPAKAMVSPSLMGSCGVTPLTVISTIPDIVRHMSNCIARAEREVFLATNYWQDSVASSFITNGIRELNRRAGERGVKIVFKIIYDRGSPKQLIEPHYIVKEKEFTGKNVKLPEPSEIPHIDLQVMNFHTPLLGTFHAKYMVVDRKIAILQSNNIQDNDNVEMMSHFEGPIVDSFYDMALISWHKKLEPPLPSHNSPAAQGGISAFDGKHGDVFGQNGEIKGHSAVVDPEKMKPRSHAYGVDKSQVQQPGAADPSAPVQSDDPKRADELTGPTTTESVMHAPLAKAEEAGKDAEGAATTEQGQTGQATDSADQAPKPDERQQGAGTDKATQEFVAAAEAPPIPQAQIEEPSPPNNPIPENTHEDPHFDDDIAGEVARGQTSVSPKPGVSRRQAVGRHLNHTKNPGFEGDPAPEPAPEEEMTPYIPHRVHEPFPMAMVNRAPYGPPDHKSVLMPQNAAWLSALRNAKKNVFIQSPTLNAEPLVPAIREAAERGIDVFCYICIGYNDAGELLPKQGGHNEMVAHNLYKSLTPAGREHLHYFWYVAKDQTKPIIQEKKKRSCHIKLMIADEHIGIMGNGNQDTQSWYHSQEINVMLDSAAVCRAWIDGLRRNQNTHIYGALSKEEGLWRDADGKEAADAIGVDPGRFAWAKGIVGAVQRVQGKGGF